MGPQYGNRRRPERATDGVRFRKVAAAFGITPKPWQLEVADLFGEIDPDTGVHAYNSLSLGVGRRAGKTLWTFLYAMTQMLGPVVDRRMFFSQQTRTDAALTMRTEWIPLLRASPLDDVFTVLAGNGQEALEYRNRRSFLRLYSPQPEALHGQSADLVIADEAWAHPVDRGRELETAIRPLMYTRPGGQFIVSSAAGDMDSTWWAHWLERGREAAEDDRGTGHCHLEWTADVPGMDPEDRTIWPIVHPGGLPASLLEAEYQLDREMFVRTILNVTDRHGSTGSPLDPAVWGELSTQTVPDYTGQISIGVDVASDQASASICAALNDGGIVQLVDARDGVEWVTAQLVKMCDDYDVSAVTLDEGSPAGVLKAPLEAAGVPLQLIHLRDVCNAASGFVESCRTGQVRHVADPALDASVTGARRRTVGDGAWTFSRKNSVVDVTPLVAASLAWWAHPASHGAHPVAVY